MAGRTAGTAGRTDDGGGGPAGPPGWRAWLGCLTALGVLLAMVYGLAWVFLSNSGYWPGSSMTTSWEAPRDREASDADGPWVAGDTVVRGRFDGLVGYELGSGKRRWEYVLPGRSETCATGVDPGAGIALLVHRRGGPAKGQGQGQDPDAQAAGCVTVTAVRLADGRELWHTTRSGSEERLAHGEDLVRAGDGLGVLFDDGRLRALDLRTGAQRWTAALPKGCVLGGLGLAPRRVLAALGCGAEAELAAYDPADGTARWKVPLDARRGVAADATLVVLSADPPAVWFGESGGERAVLGFGPDGRPRSRVDAVGDYGSITRTAADGGRLFAVASYEGGQGGSWERLVAFDLASGDELWREDVGNGLSRVDVLEARDGRVTTVRANWKEGDTLYSFDGATGDEEEDRSFRDHVVGFGDPLRGLVTHGDRVLLTRDGGERRPFTVYERW
ncbi:PQQ-binding-like beta-propeller repeat protein [Streptomyces sp. NPDC004787]|uniref:outer membrane protein assembly factor BamB family protein n=1 Tax=Streptomyces sp. NPDC004787 TaxID=3154291 RepID=UPI0033A17F74